jgi:hypothetical protein
MIFCQLEMRIIFRVKTQNFKKLKSTHNYQKLPAAELAKYR